ncbi:MAG: helix-turn-helix domain-containing protein, partial [Bradymonadaceae bacterium]
MEYDVIMEEMDSPKEIKTRIGERVRTLRKEVGLRQQDVAHRAGLSTETVSRIERGVQGVTFPNIARIADALDVPFARVCDLEVETNTLVSSAKSARVRRLLEDATPTQVDLLMEMAETVIDWSREQVDEDDGEVVVRGRL